MSIRVQRAQRDRSRQNVSFTDAAMRSISDQECANAPAQVALTHEFFQIASTRLIGLSGRDQKALTFLLAEQMQALLVQFEIYAVSWLAMNYAGDHTAARRDLEQRVRQIGSFGDTRRLASLIDGDRRYFG